MSEIGHWPNMVDNVNPELKKSGILSIYNEVNMQDKICSTVEISWAALQLQ